MVIAACVKLKQDWKGGDDGRAQMISQGRAEGYEALSNCCIIRKRCELDRPITNYVKI